MKKRWLKMLPVLLLLAVLTIVSAAGASAESLDLERKVTLTVNPGPSSEEMKDLSNADVQVDLYKIADAEADFEHGSTYTFSVLEGVTLSKNIGTYEDLLALTNEDWQTLSQDAAKSVLLDGSAVRETPALTAAASLKGEGMTADLESGLYLVIARDATLTTKQYVLTEDGKVTTIANSNEYVYTWAPELIALPTTVKEMGTDGERGDVSTAGGDWKYDVKATLKPTQDVRFGDLDIVKNLVNYDNATPATFVFSVVATLRGEKVYDDVVSLTFTSAGSETYELIEKLPVGEYTLREVTAPDKNYMRLASEWESVSPS